MINKVGEQLFAILDVSNGTISAKDICGMVNYNIKTSPRRQMLIKKSPDFFCLRSLGEVVQEKVNVCMIGLWIFQI